MIFLSAQPDEYYFLWQLQLQLFNFQTIGVESAEVHVLIGYDPLNGLNPEFERFIKKSNFGQFYCYPDNRLSKGYASSIRPHLIKQHLSRFPRLNETAIFYHDADIILKNIDGILSLESGETWYVSNARDYIGVDYLKSIDEQLFYRMCSIIDIDPAIVEALDYNSGGAQQIIKRSTVEFWEKIERDCENLYDMLEEYYETQHFLNHLKDSSPTNEIIPTRNSYGWCSDMWCLLWNAWRSGYNVEISAKLDFCIPSSRLEKWEEVDILHISGTTAGFANRFFYKDPFREFPPFYDDFSHLDKTSASLPLVNLIAEYVKDKENERINFKDVTFLVPARIESQDRKENLSILLSWLRKKFDTNVIVLEADSNPQLEELVSTNGYSYRFVEDHNAIFHRTKYLNMMIKMAKTSLVGIYDIDAIFLEDQLSEVIKLLRNGQADCVLAFDGRVYSVDIFLKKQFGNIKESAFLQSHIGKLELSAKRSCGGAIFVNRSVYLKSGMENENFGMWGPEDVERVKRLTILGYSVKRVEGPMFHLYHPNISSGYLSNDDRFKLMDIYFDVCSATKKDLEEQIAGWPWIMDE